MPQRKPASALHALLAFPQLRNVVLLVLAIVLAMPALAMFWVFPAFTALLVVITEEEVARDAAILVADIDRDLGGLTPESLGRPEQADLLLKDATRRLGSEKLRLFSADGTILQSTDRTEIGQRHTGTLFQQVLPHGRPYSKLELEGEVTTDGEPVDRSVVETYVPILREGRFLGAFEVYTDVTARHGLQGRRLYQAGLVTLAILAGLLLLLFFALLKAGRALARQRETEIQLRESAAVFEISSDAIVITDATAVIRRINPAFSEITGYSAKEAIGQTPRLLKSGHHDEAFHQDFWRPLNQQGRWEGEIFNRRKNGSIYPEWQTVTALKDGNGQLAGYVAQFSDVARRKLTEEEILFRANYDVLTGLPRPWQRRA